MRIIPFETDTHLGYTPVATVGFFDGIHLGHQKLLTHLVERANELGTKAVVITFLNHPRLVLEQSEGKERYFLLQDNAERFARIFSFGVETIITIDFTKDFAIIPSDVFLDIIIRKFGVKHLILGYDNHFGSKLQNELNNSALINNREDCSLERLDDCVLYEGVEVSSSEIRNALFEGNLERAKAMLGDDFCISGKVVYGNGLGKKIGFPTANVEIGKNKILPKFGVYAAMFYVDGKWHKAMANIGSRPTIEDNQIAIEAYIFGFKGNIYGESVRLKLIKYIRPEEKFYSIKNLKAAITSDAQNIIEFFENN